jgi:hypothetical protein
MAIASFPFIRIFSAISLNLYSINSDDRIRADDSAVRTADACVAYHLGIMITLVVDLFRKLNALCRAVLYTY